jgi:hypothetical protein
MGLWGDRVHNVKREVPDMLKARFCIACCGILPFLSPPLLFGLLFQTDLYRLGFLFQKDSYGLLLLLVT